MKNWKRLTALLVCIVLCISAFGVYHTVNTRQATDPNSTADTSGANGSKDDPAGDSLPDDPGTIFADLTGIHSRTDTVYDADIDLDTEIISQAKPEKTVKKSKVTSNENGETEDDFISQIIDQHKQEQPSASGSTTPGNENEKGELEEPFDVVYPDRFESGEVEYASNTILLKVKLSSALNMEDMEASLKDAGIGKIELMFEMTDAVWFTGYLYKEADIDKVMKEVRNLDFVITAEYNYAYQAASKGIAEEVTENPMTDDQWVLNSCDIQNAWTELKNNNIPAGGSSGVTVAVIDTGVDYTHTDLAANMWTNTAEIPDNGIDDDGNGYVDDIYGVDIIAGNKSGMDDHGHGTHVAGIVAAANNKEGVVGIAYNTKVMAIKAGDASGYFLQNNIAKAIIYAYQNGADVINMSFGGGASSIAVQDALATAYLRCVLVAAAGNEGYPNEPTDSYPIPKPSYPASLSYVLGVMSVGQSMTESYFSNWDATLYNSKEYEVYAPGEQILSTLPGNQYGKLSGTSMASPVVAAQAALLRSYFTDRASYPTKYIYGQIVGSADKVVSCCRPDMHTVMGKLHNIPGCVNFFSAMTTMPKPDISAADITIFDTPGYTADAAGLTAGCEEINNGDGIIDAGETLAIGFTLRNRWGMGKDVTVHVDSIGSANLGSVVNPYVEYLNNDINYGSVGTYSQSDCGKLYDGDEWTGWENPFYVKVKKDCPNEYTITLNLTVTYKNALDESDNTVYKSQASTLLTVRRGTLLPSKITEDTTLTADNYYILPNACMIMDGVTVTVEPGTQIQFWCSDPADAYADTAITYLKVNGTFICEGTEEQPIEIFPSGWMDDYEVYIYKAGNGTVNLKHTNITNPVLDINTAENCEFNQTYPVNVYKYRSLDNGIVKTYNRTGYIQATTAKNCAFYKLGGYETYYRFNCGGDVYEGCAFIDSAISFSAKRYQNCLFYGNNNYEASKYAYYEGTTSSLSMVPINESVSVENVFTSNELRRTYIVVNFAEDSPYEVSDFYDEMVFFAKMNGFDIASIDGEDEYEFINEHLKYDYYSRYMIQDCRNGEHEIASMTKDTCVPIYEIPWYITGFIFEMFYDGYVTDIQVDKSIVNMDIESTYAISAKVTPSYKLDQILYESEDESIAVVSEEGIITPVSSGTTKIKVYAPDRGVWNYVTVNVKANSVVPTAIASKDKLTVNVGESAVLDIMFTPENATRRNLTYKSSNESVASVSKSGVVTANSKGNTIITVTGFNGIETLVNVQCVTEVRSISFSSDTYLTKLNSEEVIEKDQKAIQLYTDPYDAEVPDIVWESSNPDICYVNEHGNLVKVSEGAASIRARVIGKEISDEILITVGDNYVSNDIKKFAFNYGYGQYAALTESGNLYLWGQNNDKEDHLYATEIRDFMPDSSGLIMCYSIVLLDNRGEVKTLFSEEPILENIRFLSEYSSLSNSNESFFAVSNDGIIYGWGCNDYGQLGDGTFISRDKPVVVDLDANVVKICNTAADSDADALMLSSTLFLDQEGNVYLAGSEKGINVPTKIAENAVDITTVCERAYIEFADKIICVNDNSVHWKKNPSEYISGKYYYYSENNKIYYSSVYDGSTYEELNEVNLINDVKRIEGIDLTTFILTESGKLYGLGSAGCNGFLNGDKTASKPTLINLEEVGYAGKINMSSWNGEQGYVTENTIKCVFDLGLLTDSNFSSIRLRNSKGEILRIGKRIDFNKFTVSSTTPFVDGETYTLFIPDHSFKTARGDYNEEYNLTFIYHEEEFSFDAETYSLQVGEESLTIAPTISSSRSDQLEWTSSDETVAYVNDAGHVVGVSDGVAKLTASLAGTDLSASAYVVVGNAKVAVTGTNIKDEIINSSKLQLKLNLPVNKGTNFTKISCKDSKGTAVSCSSTIEANRLTVKPSTAFKDGTKYTLTIPQGALSNSCAADNDVYTVNFYMQYIPLEKTGDNLDEGVLTYDSVQITFNQEILNMAGTITLTTKEGESVLCSAVFDGEVVTVTPNDGFTNEQRYVLTLPAGAVSAAENASNTQFEMAFIYENMDAVHEAVTDQEIVDARHTWTPEEFMALWEQYTGKGFNYRFYSNAIINRMSNDDTNTWLRVTGSSSENYETIRLGQNYWGTTDQNLIDKQILDFDDFQQLADIDASQYLTEAPSDTFPFVTDAYLMVNGEQQTTVSNGEVEFVVEFNRAMDTEKNVEVTFGSSYPYREYQVEGAFVTPTEWHGKAELKTLIENGYQYFSVSEGQTAADENGEHLKLYTDWGRFPFEIDTTAAMALIMEGVATDSGISLSWTQDDYDTLAGYNLYRSTSEDGQYTRINRTVIPADTRTWFDDTVLPGETYYYNFTVVESDMTESEPSGKIVITAYDTMAPDIYHSPVYFAFTGNKLIISATVTDNVAVENATVYYRTTGTEEWKTAEMIATNDKYTAVIDASEITLDGLQYYIDAFDGITHTFKGSAEAPYDVTVQMAVDSNSIGDVDGNGAIELKDAMMLLMAVNDRLNLNEEQFARADIDSNGILEAREALRIIQYVNGSIGSVLY